MPTAALLDSATLFCAGLLAGALVVIDYGVGPATAAIQDEQLQIQMRQAMIRGLRVLVPVLFILTILSGIAQTVLEGVDPAFFIRGAGVLAVVACFVLALIGTAPINATILTWQPSAPPKNWRAMVSRWQRLDVVRTWTGVAAFALFLAATALKLAAH